MNIDIQANLNITSCPMAISLMTLESGLCLKITCQAVQSMVNYSSLEVGPTAALYILCECPKCIISFYSYLCIYPFHLLLLLLLLVFFLI